MKINLPAYAGEWAGDVGRWSRTLRTPKPSHIFRFIVLALTASLSTSALGYSKEYCTSLLNATADAYRALDWQRLLNVATDMERNCPRYITVNQVASSINSQD